MKKIATIILVLLGVAAVAAGAAFWLRGSDERMFSALEAEQRPSGAVARLQKIVDKHPEDLNAQKWLLRLEIENGDLSAAQNRLTLLQVKAPNYYGTLSNACLFYLHKRLGRKAISNCERAAELSGRSVDDLNRLASAFLMVEKYAPALPILKEAQKKAPDNLEVMNNLGYGFLLAGIPEEAARILKQVVDKDPNFLEARKNLAHAYYAGKQYPEAAAEIDKILIQDPRNKDLLMIMAFIQRLHFHNKELAAQYARRAMTAGMDQDRALQLYEMISGSKPGETGAPRTAQPPPGAAPATLAPPALPSTSTPPAPAHAPGVLVPAPAPAPGATAKARP